MRIYVEDNPAQTLPEDKRIVLKNIEAYKNKKGQWCLSFGSVNHKYLGVEFNTSTNALMSIDVMDKAVFERLEFFAQGFSIETGNPSAGDWDWKTIFLVPESKEEYEEISGVAAVLPTKWHYLCAIIPFNDIYMEDDSYSDHITYKEAKENEKGVPND
jgi:hypothetical protein